jgi:hypothetical protein
MIGDTKALFGVKLGVWFLQPQAAVRDLANPPPLSRYHRKI